jgi:hypothetical protein
MLTFCEISDSTPEASIESFPHPCSKSRPLSFANILIRFPLEETANSVSSVLKRICGFAYLSIKK